MGSPMYSSDTKTNVWDVSDASFPAKQHNLVQLCEPEFNILLNYEYIELF